MAIAAFGASNSVDPVKRLAKVGVFVFGGLGLALVTTQGERDYRAIEWRGHAAEDFAEIFKAGTPEAKAYALVGMRGVNSQWFNSLAASQETSDVWVTVGHGCVVTEIKMRHLVREIRAGVYH